MLESWKRIFTISKKPGWEEYSQMLKVISLGVAIISIIGFAVMILFTLTGLGQA